MDGEACNPVGENDRVGKNVSLVGPLVGIEVETPVTGLGEKLKELLGLEEDFPPTGEIGFCVGT